MRIPSYQELIDAYIKAVEEGPLDTVIIHGEPERIRETLCILWASEEDNDENP